jgi:hypothetical protein
MDAPRVPISWGELIDKIAILEIKSKRLNSVVAKSNVEKELVLLNEIIVNLPILQEILELRNELSTINAKLWDIEDDIRAKESVQKFDEEFIELARSVYKLNDVRAATKRKINEFLSSDLKEEKSYATEKIRSE